MGSDKGAELGASPSSLSLLPGHGSFYCPGKYCLFPKLNSPWAFSSSPWTQSDRPAANRLIKHLPVQAARPQPRRQPHSPQAAPAAPAERNAPHPPGFPTAEPG